MPCIGPTRPTLDAMAAFERIRLFERVVVEGDDATERGPFLS